MTCQYRYPGTRVDDADRVAAGNADCPYAKVFARSESTTANLTGPYHRAASDLRDNQAIPVANDDREGGVGFHNDLSDNLSVQAELALCLQLRLTYSKDGRSNVGEEFVGNRLPRWHTDFPGARCTTATMVPTRCQR